MKWVGVQDVYDGIKLEQTVAVLLMKIDLNILVGNLRKF